MTKFNFLVNPDSLGLTSCLSHGSFAILMREDLADIMNILRTATIEELNEAVTNGRVCINKFITSRFGYNDNYRLNDEWKLKLTRIGMNLYTFILMPYTSAGLTIHNNGLRSIAKQYIISDRELMVWVDYPWLSKLFYLKEYAKVIVDGNLISAIGKYKVSFSMKEYFNWVEDNNWSIGHTHPVFRKYLKQQMEYRSSRLHK